MNKKKLLALLMSLVMTLTLMPMTVFADDEHTEHAYGEDGICTVCGLSQYPKAAITKLSGHSAVAVQYLDQITLYNGENAENFDCYGTVTPTIAYTFAVNPDSKLNRLEDFRDYNCDFIVSITKGVKAYSFGLFGNYGNYGNIAFFAPEDVDGGVEIPLLGSVANWPWSYDSISSLVGSFTCGAFNTSEENIGKTFTVKLVLWPNNANETHTKYENANANEVIVVSETNYVIDSVSPLYRNNTPYIYKSTGSTENGFMIATGDSFGSGTVNSLPENYNGPHYAPVVSEAAVQVVGESDSYDTVEAAVAAAESTDAKIAINDNTVFAGVLLTEQDTVKVESTATVATVSAKEVSITKGNNETPTKTAYVVTEGEHTSVVTDAVDDTIKNENVEANDLVKVANVLAAQVAESNEVAAADLTEVIIGVESTANENPPVNTVSYDVDPYAIIKQTAKSDQKVTLSNKDLAANASFIFQLNVSDIVTTAGATVIATHSWEADPDTNRAAGSETKTYQSEGGNGNYFITVTTDHFSTWDLTTVTEGAVAAVFDSNNALVNSYATLPAAFAAATDGQTIVLLQNTELTERLFVNAGTTPAYAGSNNRYATTTENKSITLDLNNHNIQSASNIALAGGSLNITGTGTIKSTANGLAPIEIRGTGDLANKRTLTIGQNVTLDGSTTGYGLNVFGSNDAQKNLIDVTVNGTVNGTLFVLGNLKNAENAINIVVNGTVDAPNATGDGINVGIALNGNGHVTVNEGATVKGDTGIEVRAGKLTVNGGNITGTATTYSVKSNGSGSSTKGAGIAIVQHTTQLPIDATINGGTIAGCATEKAITVAAVEQGTNMAVVQVQATNSFVQSQSEVPEGYKWKDTTSGTYELVEKELTFRGGSLRRRVITGTTTVVDYETDLRFGFMLPAGAAVNTSESYFRWSLSDNVDADTGNLINITRVDTSGSRPLVNMVITKIPTAYYDDDIYCFIHIKYTLNNEIKTLDLAADGTDTFKRSVKDVCEGLIEKNDTTTVWPGYAQSLKTAAGWTN